MLLVPFSQSPMCAPGVAEVQDMHAAHAHLLLLSTLGSPLHRHRVQYGRTLCVSPEVGVLLQVLHKGCLIYDWTT